MRHHFLRRPWFQPGPRLVFPAGFGKTTLVGAWVAGCEASAPDVRVAWLSLDEGDGELARFLTYLVAALQTITAAEAGVDQRVLGMLQSPPPPAESLRLHSPLCG